MQIDLARLMEQHDELEGRTFDPGDGHLLEPFEAKGKPLQATIFPAEFEAKGKIVPIA